MTASLDRGGLEPLVLILALISHILAPLAESTPCYTPAGTDVNLAYNVAENWFYAPCNNVAAVSMCCAIGPGRNGSAEIRRPDGLCYNNYGPSYWRESCTDLT
jgi:hypothetical protein